MTTRCEDYPCCGHTDGLPCNWTAPDDSNDPHLLCDHEAGICDVWEDECDPRNSHCATDDEDCEVCKDYWLDVEAESMRERVSLGYAEPGSLMSTHGIAYNRESYFR